MFCTNCGEKLIEGARFCEKCGVAVAAPAVEPIEVPASVESEAPVAPEMPAYEVPASEMPVYEAPAAPEAPAYAAAAAPMPTYPAAAPQPERTVKGLVFSIIALVAGIMALVFFWYPFVGLIFGGVGIVFGALGKKTGKRKMAIAGIICGAIAAGLNLIFILVMVIGLAAIDAYNAFDSYYYY